MQGLLRLLVLPLLVLAAALASLLPATSSATPAQAASPELRAYWVDAFHPGIYNPQQIDKLVADVKAANMNAVVVQVGRRGDCFCNKAIMPRTEEAIAPLPFDPLQTLIDKAHAQGIQVHAWINTTIMWGSLTPPLAPSHIFNTHGPSKTGYDNWVTVRSDGLSRDGTNFFLDPGHPDAAAYVVSMATSIVANYDVDGINLDYIRYPDGNLAVNVPSWGYNPAAVARFQLATGRSDTPAPTDAQWMQWRRDQVSDIVRRVYLESYALKPSVRVSADTIVYGYGPQTQGGWTSTNTYLQVLQDWRGWLQEGILDLSIPMNYKREYDSSQRQMYEEWNEFIKENQFGRQAAIGAGIYMNSVGDTIAQVRKALAPSATGKKAAGWVGYSYGTPDSMANQGTRSADASRAELTRALTQPSEYDPNTSPVFASPAAVPAMTWKTQATTGHLKGTLKAGDGTPLDGVRVELYDATTKTLAAARSTDASGWYGFVDLRPGRYNVMLGGAKAGAGPVAVVDVVAGQLTTKDLTLCSSIVPEGLFCVEYFDNATLGAPAVYATMEPTIDHDWGTGRPAPRVGADNFSARWTGTFAFDTSGTYTFTAVADDGVRVRVDDVLVIDKWLEQAPTTYKASVPLVAGDHKVTMEYYEKAGGAVARLSWALGCPAGQVMAEYYGSVAPPSGGAVPAASLCEVTPIVHDWGDGRPTDLVGYDNFSARYVGLVDFAVGTYTFTATADDGARVWVDRVLQIDGWADQAPTTHQKTIVLSGGFHSIEMEYHETTGNAKANLDWISIGPQVTLLSQPQRLVDTRPGSGRQGAGLPLNGYTSHRRFTLAGSGGIPSYATAVLVNLTAVGYSADGWLAAYPACTTRPATSNVNFDTVENAIANFAIVKLGTGAGCQGAIDVTGLSGANVVVDAVGYLLSTDSDQVVLLGSPVRAVDTRSSSGFQGAGLPLNGYTSSRRYDLAGQNGVPADATAVLVNLTAVGYSADGWLSAYPACTSKPSTSSLNFDTTENAIANFAIVKLGASSAGSGCGGAIDVTGLSGTNVIVDVVGYLVSPPSSQIAFPSTPQRVVDTRQNSGYPGAGQSLQGASSPRCYQIAGQGGVPVDARGAILNLTAVGYTRDGWIKAYPDGGSAPATSSLNYDTQESAIANTAIVRLGAEGKVCLVASSTTNAIVDVSGYLVDPP